MITSTSDRVLIGTETHNYDGQLGPIYHKLVEKYSNETLTSFDESLTEIYTWINKSRSFHDQIDNNQLRPNYDLVIKTLDLLKNHPEDNYDATNQIHVEDLLPRVVDVVKNFEISGCDIFLISLSEIIELGQCSQGRVIRLLNFYIPYKNL